jgi:primosomal protein N' (replication factor Y) (superfamily II helicase)
MSRETRFVSVILPLALPKVLTYRVPHEWNDAVRIGVRVVVPLGAKKVLTGIVSSIQNQAPEGYQAKYIEHILDEAPIVHTHQLKFWEWMADYYKCSVGEVMNAALPSGLKLSSETVIVANNEFTDVDSLSDKEFKIVAALGSREQMSLTEVSELLKVKFAQPVLRKLIERGVVFAVEELKERFKPKTTDFLHLGLDLDNDDALKALFDTLEKRQAVRQTDALMSFLVMADYDKGARKPVERLALQKQADAPAAVIMNMVQKGIFTLETRETGRLGQHLIATEASHPLSELQANAKQTIVSAFEQKEVVLLHGITSSGKTEVYISLIEDELAKGNQVLFLLPEIALTTQIITRLRAFFGRRIGVYHSGYSEHERTEVWNKVLSDIPGEYDVILGARSALFLPFTRLGLIIIDEEHEHSFKQYEPAPRYHARDAAIVLARPFNAKVLLGSATPAIESYYNAKTGKYGLAEMLERYGGLPLPEVVIADLRAETKAKTLSGSFSDQLLREIKQAVDQKEQVILFQNRRGYSPLWQCQHCGWTPMCTRCDVSMTYHKAPHLLKCHYCGYHADPPQACHACGSTELRMLGFGTEKIEEEIAQLVPDIRVQRMDLDTTRSKTGYQQIIHEFEEGNIDVLVGTQMVTKGLDFDRVSLVGVLNADKMMRFPDFRSIERSFQVIMQVAGRAGRRQKRGKVVIQTFQPEHWLFELIKSADYTRLYEHEVNVRGHFGYPPFVRLMRITFRHKDDQVVQAACAKWNTFIKPLLGHRLLGPERPVIPRINTYYLWEFIVKLERNHDLSSYKDQVASSLKQLTAEAGFKTLRITVDVDPL